MTAAWLCLELDLRNLLSSLLWAEALRGFQNKRRRQEVLNERVKGERRNIIRSRASATAERTQQLLKERRAAPFSLKCRLVSSCT